MAELATPSADLVIDIYPRGWDIWRGTKAQLMAERLVPPHIKWPDRVLNRTWHEGNLTCKLRRCRPPETSDPQDLWVEGDYWILRRSRTSLFLDEFAEARFYEKLCKLARDLWEQTPEGVNEFKRWKAAQNDKRFQDFLARLSTKDASTRNAAARKK